MIESTLGWVGEGIDRLFFFAALRGKQPSPRVVRAAPDNALDLARDFYRDAADSGRLFADPAPAALSERRAGSIEGGAIADLSWPSGYRALHPRYGARTAAEPENGACRARWFRHDRPAPALICLHGWGAGRFALEERAFAARALYRRGLDVVLMVLPFHAARGRPLTPPAFPSPDPFITNEAFAQATHDVRSLVQAICERAPVGLCGMSLGGCTAALCATVEPSLAFVVPIIPVASVADMMWRIGEGTPARIAAEARGMTEARFLAAFAPTCPLERAPLVEKERVLVIAGARDRVVPEDHAGRLQAHLSARPLVTFAGSHLLQHDRARIFRALLAFVREIGVLG